MLDLIQKGKTDAAELALYEHLSDSHMHDDRSENSKVRPKN